MKTIKQYLGKVSVTCNGTWDINRQYDRLCLVNDGFFASYISRVPVPAGTSLENRDYWQPVASLKDDIKVYSKEFEKNVLQLIADIQFKLKSARITVQNMEERDALMWNEVGVGCEVYVIDTKQSWILDSIVCSDTPEASYKEWHLEADGKIDSEEKYELEGNFDNLTADRAICDALGNIIHDTYISRDTIKNYTNTIISDFLDNWRYEIQNGTITYDMLSNALKELFEANGTEVTNLPDEEDLTVKDNQLKFKDRPYNELDFTGKGHIILRKNWMNNINLLEQSMLQEANTIYDIRYTFCLDGNTVEVPDNCVLNLMEGGELRNGTLHCNNTMIAVFDTKYLNVILTGTYKFFSSEHGITINVIDNLESDDNTSALSARQGKILNEKIEDINDDLTEINNNITEISNKTNDLQENINNINIDSIAPEGGTDGQVLKKTSNGIKWANDEKGFELPEGGNDGQVLKKRGNDAVWADDDTGEDITIDSVLSDSSINPVQNKVIKKALDNKADENHTHTSEDITDLQDKLNDKANTNHTHSHTDIDDWDTELSKKANSTHNHTVSQVTDIAEVAKSGSYNDLSDKPTIPTAYNLPIASASQLGGIKIGVGLEITQDGTLNVIIESGGGGGSYTLPVATKTTLGGVKQGNTVTISSDGILEINIDKLISSFPVADFNKLGIVKGVVDGNVYNAYYGAARAGINFTNGLITLSNNWAGNTVAIWDNIKDDTDRVGNKRINNGVFEICHTASGIGESNDDNWATIESANVGPLILVNNGNQYTFKKVEGEKITEINICARGTTAQRPSFVSTGTSTDYDFVGFQYYDTDLKKPIWFDGRNWKDATGTQV